MSGSSQAQARAASNALIPRSKSRSAMRNPSASGSSTRYGTAMHRMKARHDASTPCCESSTVTQPCGGTPRRRAASRNTSGAGLPRATSSAETTISRCCERPAAALTFNHRGGFPPADVAPLVLAREDDAAPRQELLVGEEVVLLAVDERPVDVEDHRPHRIAGLPAHARR